KQGRNCFYLHLGSGKTEMEEKQLADSLQLTGSVSFAGNKLNVREYIVASDVFVMPSRCEGLSIASIEAMACGIPGILYNSPGLVDMIKNDDNGFLVEPDPANIAGKIIVFMDNPA